MGKEKEPNFFIKFFLFNSSSLGSSFILLTLFVTFCLSFHLTHSLPRREKFLSNFDSGHNNNNYDGNLKLQPIGGIFRVKKHKRLEEVTPKTSGSDDWSPGHLGIAHGSPVSNDTRLPYQLYLLIKVGRGYYECGAVIISPKTAITAAHCVVDSKPQDVTAYAGKLRHSSRYEEGQQILHVSKVTVHPNYLGRGERSVWENDVAHLTFEHPLQFTNFVSAIPLSPVPLEEGAMWNPDLAGLTATASGWGLASSSSPYGLGEPSHILQEVNVTILSHSDCVKYSMYDNVTQNHICTHGANGSGTCQGDSGGPLVIKNYKFPNGTRGPLLVGLTSFSIVRDPCGWDIFPNVYTRLSTYAPWIKEMDGQNGNLQFLAFNNDDSIHHLFLDIKKKFHKIYKTVRALFSGEM